VIARVIRKQGRTVLLWTRPAKKPALTLLRGRQYVTRIPKQTPQPEKEVA
jgi:hypothetical protein